MKTYQQARHIAYCLLVGVCGQGRVACTDRGRLVDFVNSKVDASDLDILHAEIDKAVIKAVRS